MFCPQCGAEVASDRVRFCTHCRFPVGSMKEFIAAETSKNEAEEEKTFYPLRQRDINLGAGLMLIGALKAILASMATHSFKDTEIAVLLFVLGLLFSAVILFSQLSPRQRGLTLGATIIFAGTLLGIVAGLAIGATPGLLFGISVSLAVSFLWMRLARMFMQIFFDKESAPEKKVPYFPQPALTASSAQVAPDLQPTTNHMKEPEMAIPFSVAEDTTETLRNKQPFTQS
ncbi:MAG: zinc ribbon domain-containing protein [Blastocatellia bacterium]|nr:zinc ribbon domain-containing protein [Blastocatellia bacterium]